MLRCGLIFGVRRSLSITRQHDAATIARLPWGLKIQVTRFSLKIFVRVVISWTSLEAWGFPKRRQSTYLAAFLLCWLCVFALAEIGEKFIRLGTFEVASLTTSGTTFGLAIPMLASIYHGLNRITKAGKPSLSGSFFPSYYLYGWLPTISRLTMCCSLLLRVPW